ncbi:sushi, von Willebrand factor type A, EGF and pentraxin domain-containing protein 1-like [Lineus longissimus]|uniref:sushi, von Willebrand factor type A, EGF and pentraxin domain-containing protein 1-like n=1 Tax=Lineus longissimus TaxID=88925 RepID=UPI00315DCD3B
MVQEPTLVRKTITCEPPVISNGHVSVIKPALYGSTVTYHCNQGFVLDGQGSSKCIQNGTDNVYGKWTDQTPVCKAISCDTPFLLNGQVIAGGQSTHGTTVIFKCNDGFILVGKTNSTCVHEDPKSAKGKWSEPTPVCKTITCEPPVIPNGYVSVIKPAVYGSTVTYHCNQGFVLDGKGSSKCSQNGTDNVYGKWTDQSPVCKAISCDKPLLLNGQVIAGGQSTHGTTVIFRCNEGFVLEGKTYSTCVHEDQNSAKGKWSEPTPVCKAITCEPPVISNGHVSVIKPAVYGSTVTYHCNQGFVLDGKGSSKCSQNGTDNVYGKWTNQSPVCKAISCDTPLLLNGQVIAGGLSTHGTSVIFRCDEGFILEGKTKSTCIHEDPNRAKGNWSEPTPVCKAINCDTPFLLNGQVTASELSTHGTTVNFRCYEGFILDGKTNSTCVHEDPNSAKGKWSEPTPVCKVITCEEPKLKNGNVTTVVSPATFSSVVNYTCNEAFVLEGAFNSTCTQNGTENVKGEWSEPSPTCREITCDQPVLQHGKASTSSLQYNSTVTYSCEENYSLTGKAKSTCVQEDKTSIKGVWADPIPICTDLESPSSTIDHVDGNFGGRANTRSAMNIGIDIGCATVVLVLVSIGIMLAIKKKSRESQPHETPEEDPPAKSNVTDYQNPLYDMEEWDGGQNETRGSPHETFRLDVV